MFYAIKSLLPFYLFCFLSDYFFFQHDFNLNFSIFFTIFCLFIAANFYVVRKQQRQQQQLQVFCVQFFCQRYIPQRFFSFYITSHILCVIRCDLFWNSNAVSYEKNMAQKFVGEHESFFMFEEWKERKFVTKV